MFDYILSCRLEIRSIEAVLFALIIIIIRAALPLLFPRNSIASQWWRWSIVVLAGHRKWRHAGRRVTYASDWHVLGIILRRHLRQRRQNHEKRGFTAFTLQWWRAGCLCVLLQVNLADVAALKWVSARYSSSHERNVVAIITNIDRGN